MIFKKRIYHLTVIDLKILLGLSILNDYAFSSTTITFSPFLQIFISFAFNIANSIKLSIPK